MNPTDYILEIENELTEKFCDTIIEYIDTSNKAIDGKILNSYGNSHVPNSRICKDLYVPVNGEWFDIFNNSYYNSIKIYFDKFPKIKNDFFSDKVYNDYFLITKYPADVGNFKVHVDQQTSKYNPRMLVSIWYLNTVNYGGETNFPLLNNFKIKPKKGKLVIFPANWIFAHEGCIPLKQEKYIVSSFTYTRLPNIPKNEQQMYD